MKFPKVLFIVREKDGGVTYYASFTDIQAIDNNQEIGIYELKEIKDLVIEKKLIVKSAV